MADRNLGQNPGVLWAKTLNSRSWSCKLQCPFAKANVTKVHRIGGYSRNRISHSPETKRMRPRWRQAWFLQRDVRKKLPYVFLSLAWRLLSSFTLSSSSHPGVSPGQKTPVTLDDSPSSFYLDYLCKDPICKYSHMLRSQKLDFKVYF